MRISANHTRRRQVARHSGETRPGDTSPPGRIFEPGSGGEIGLRAALTIGGTGPRGLEDYGTRQIDLQQSWANSVASALTRWDNVG